MKDFFFNLIILTQFYLLYKAKPHQANKNTQNSPALHCSNYSTCYDCNSPGSNCRWTNSVCSPSKQEDKWINKLLQCKDESSQKQSKDNCHAVIISSKYETLVNPKPSKDNLSSGLFCNFTLLIEGKTVNISLKRSLGIFFGIEIIHHKDIDEFDENPPQHKVFQASNVKQINLYYYGTIPLNETLFELQVTTKSNNSFGTTYLGIVIFCSAIIFIGLMIILIFFFIHFLKNKRLIDTPPNGKPITSLEKEMNKRSSNGKLQIGDLEGQVNNVQTGDCNQTPIIAKEVLFNSEMIKLFNEKCSICLEKIEKDAKVLILACFHGFHSKCMSTWIQNNRLNMFCPICHCKLELLGNDP